MRSRSGGNERTVKKLAHELTFTHNLCVLSQPRSADARLRVRLRIEAGVPRSDSFDRRGRPILRTGCRPPKHAALRRRQPRQEPHTSRCRSQRPTLDRGEAVGAPAPGVAVLHPLRVGAAEDEAHVPPHIATRDGSPSVPRVLQEMAISPLSDGQAGGEFTGVGAHAPAGRAGPCRACTSPPARAGCDDGRAPGCLGRGWQRDRPRRRGCSGG